MDTNPMDHEMAELFSTFIDEMNSGTNKPVRDFPFANGVLGHSLLGLIETVMPMHTDSLFVSPTSAEREAVFAQITRELAKENSPKNVAAKSVPITQRTDILILMMYFMSELWGDVWGNVKLIKLPFLLAQEGNCGSFVHDFYFPSMTQAAYNYGAFDQNVLDDVDGLVAMGIIQKRLPPSKQKRSDGELGIPKEKQVDWIYELAPKGKQIAEMLLRGAAAQDPDIAQKIREVIQRHGNKTMAELLDYTYNKYPDSAKNSKVKDKYLRPKINPSSPDDGKDNE